MSYGWRCIYDFLVATTLNDEQVFDSVWVRCIRFINSNGDAKILGYEFSRMKLIKIFVRYLNGIVTLLQHTARMYVEWYKKEQRLTVYFTHFILAVIIQSTHSRNVCIIYPLAFNLLPLSS